MIDPWYFNQTIVLAFEMVYYEDVPIIRCDTKLQLMRGMERGR
jgi:hypothetical protein